MLLSTSSVASRTLISQRTAAGAVLLLWIGYTALQTLFVTRHVPEPWSAILGFAPGAAVLAAAGLTREQLFLRTAPLSRKGLAVLAGIFVFALVAVVPFGRWQGWNWMKALVYAPASGVSQELFFRAVLLRTIAMKHRPGQALILHSLLFGLWHIGPLFVGAPLWAVAAVMLVPFMSSVGWGWQVRHDRTVIWAMVQHSLIWVVAGQFPMPD